MHKKTTSLLAALLLSAMAWAFDFQATVPSGQTLYFNYIDGGVQVVHPSTKTAYAMAWDGYDKPTGDLVVPAYVSDGDSTYRVLSMGIAALSNCYNLHSVELAEGIEQMEGYVFLACSGLKTVKLPSTLASMGNQAFGNMQALSDLWLASTEPPVTHTYTFYNTEIATVTLHLDCNASAAYHDNEPWSGFGAVDTSSCTVRLTVRPGNAAMGSASGSGAYAKGELVTLSATPAEGYSFLCWHDGDKQNPRLVDAVNDSLFMAIFADPASLHDTLYFAVPTHDTVTVTDTLLINTVLHDTLYFAVPTYDTVTVTDTLLVPTLLHDTVTVVVHTIDTVSDTVFTTVHDTVMPTFYHIRVESDNPSLGLGVGSALLPAGIEAEVCALPMEGGRFVAWSDGSAENPRRLTVNGEMALTAHFETLAATEATAPQWTASAIGTLLTVSGAEGERLRLFDTQGRRLATVDRMAATTLLRLPAAGVYLVQVGQWPARKIVATTR
ncbi:MAG: leucine-rich repeat protein [Bacteroidales bacterium]|nr:leucine-rich repeat protein [Bacteroidales bacterium]